MQPCSLATPHSHGHVAVLSVCAITFTSKACGSVVHCCQHHTMVDSRVLLSYCKHTWALLHEPAVVRFHNFKDERSGPQTTGVFLAHRAEGYSRSHTVFFFWNTPYPLWAKTPVVYDPPLSAPIFETNYNVHLSDGFNLRCTFKEQRGRPCISICEILEGYTGRSTLKPALFHNKIQHESRRVVSIIDSGIQKIIVCLSEVHF